MCGIHRSRTTFSVLEVRPDTVDNNGSGTGIITAKLSQLIDVENSEGTLVDEQGINQVHLTMPSGQFAILRDSILTLQDTVDRADDRYPDKPMLLGKLGVDQLALYESPGEPAYTRASQICGRQYISLTGKTIIQTGRYFLAVLVSLK